ncbi:MAG: polysaccharide deacetylase family protein [Candidatus Micrarchaeota archaeon]
MVRIAFSVDTERDSSHAIPGNPFQATTFGLEKPTFTATEKGLGDLLEILEEADVPSTFFFEAKTALVLNKKRNLKKQFKGHEIGFHGFNHEDFTGMKTGVKIAEKDRKKIFDSGIKVLEKVFSCKPRGFRAPYLGVDDGLLDLVSKRFKYDSSCYGYEVSYYKKMPRIPIVGGRDKIGGKIQGFLWPLMEGDRKWEDYVFLVKEALKKKADSIVIATHSWHTRMTRKNGRLGEKEAEKRKALVKKVLLEVKKLRGVEFSALNEARTQA